VGVLTTPWIAFEGLDIRLEGISRGFELFGFTIHWYGVIIALGFSLALILGLRACKKYGFSQDDILAYVIVGAPTALIFARLYFVAFQWQYYSDDLMRIFNFRGGGLAIYGAVIGIGLVAFIMTKIKKQNVLDLLDLALPYVLLGQAIGRWGNFINQEAYGIETSLPWGMSGSDIGAGIYRGNIAVHPNFLYESLWCFLMFALILVYRNKVKHKRGEIMCLYFVGYGVGRAVIESIRGGDTLLFLGQRVSMWLSILLVLGFGAYFVYLRFFKKYKEVNEVKDEAEDTAEE